MAKSSASCQWHVAPRNALEQTVASAFASALGRTNVSVYDHFFELGGDSLAAIQLLSSLSQTLGFKIPAGVLLSHPTVAVFTEMIPSWTSGLERHEQSRLDARLVHGEPPALITLRDHGAEPPLFICPGGHGTENELLVFARMLATTDMNRPVHGFRMSALLGQLSSMTTLADMAAIMVESLFKYHPEGPWVLVGECVSGVTAIEIARQIQLIDPTRMPEQVILLDARTNEYLQRHGSPDKIQAVVTPRVEPYFRLLLDWKSQSFDFPVQLIVSDEYNSEGPDPTLGWQDLCSAPVCVHRVPGDHHGYIRQHAGSVAALIQRILARGNTKPS